MSVPNPHLCASSECAYNLVPLVLPLVCRVFYIPFSTYIHLGASLHSLLKTHVPTPYLVLFSPFHLSISVCVLASQSYDALLALRHNTFLGEKKSFHFIRAFFRNGGF